MQKHIQHNKDEQRHFFRKIYLSLYWKGCVWEGVGNWTELPHINPHSYGYHSLSFPFSWAAQPEAWGPSLSGTWFSFQHLLSNWSEALNSNCNCSIGGREGPLCWVLVLSTASYLQLTRTSCALSYIIVYTHSIQPVDSQGIPLIPSTGCTCYLHRCISYFDCSAGVNMQHLLGFDIWIK